jgi:serine/threonine-protein kinase PknK
VMVDVWALGATLYTLLAGRSPFVLPGADNSQRELISRITNSPVPRLGRADVPESLELALSTAMAKSAASRYSSAHAFALALQRIQAELNLSVTPFEVLEEAHAEESHPDDGFAETRVRNIASVDPDQTGNAPTFPARTRPANPAAFTPILPSAPPSGPVPGPATAPSGPVPGPGGRPDQHDDWVQGTMLRGSLAAAPQATAPQAGARTIRDDSDLAATVNRPQAPVAAPAEAPADHSKRNLWLAVAGGAVLVVAVVVGLVLGSSRPEPVANPTEQVSKPPADALDNGRVPDVTNLVGVKGAAGKAKFTWTNPQPKPGDTFKWRVVDLGAEGGTYQATDQPMVEVALNPADKTCIQVMIVRSDGASSPQEAESIGCVK